MASAAASEAAAAADKGGAAAGVSAVSAGALGAGAGASGTATEVGAPAAAPPFASDSCAAVLTVAASPAALAAGCSWSRGCSGAPLRLQWLKARAAVADMRVLGWERAAARSLEAEGLVRARGAREEGARRQWYKT